MRTLARSATSSLVALCVALMLAVAAVAAVAAIGMVSTRSATSMGNTIAGDELTTAVVTGQVGRDIDAAYATGEAAVQATQSAERSRMLGSLYSSMLPTVDADLSSLQQLHAGDPPAELADLGLFSKQWTTVRDLLSLAGLTAEPPQRWPPSSPLPTSRSAPTSPGLSAKELDDARADHTAASADTAHVIGLLAGVAVLGIVVGFLFLIRGIRGIRRNLEPSQDQAEFADTLPIASGEDEAHWLLQRYLERTLPATTAVVLNRNNSADRLEAVTPLRAARR